VAFLAGAVLSDLTTTSTGTKASIYALFLLAASYPVFRVVKFFDRRLKD
jgi:hypothetical protein